MPVYEAGMLDPLLAVLSGNAEGFSIRYQIQLIEELRVGTYTCGCCNMHAKQKIE